MHRCPERRPRRRRDSPPDGVQQTNTRPLARSIAHPRLPRVKRSRWGARQRPCSRVGFKAAGTSPPGRLALQGHLCELAHRFACCLGASFEGVVCCLLGPENPGCPRQIKPERSPGWAFSSCLHSAGVVLCLAEGLGCQASQNRPAARPTLGRGKRERSPPRPCTRKRVRRLVTAPLQPGARTHQPLTRAAAAGSGAACGARHDERGGRGAAHPAPAGAVGAGGAAGRPVPAAHPAAGGCWGARAPPPRAAAARPWPFVFDARRPSRSQLPPSPLLYHRTSPTPTLSPRLWSSTLRTAPPRSTRCRRGSASPRPATARCAVRRQGGGAAERLAPRGVAWAVVGGAGGRRRRSC